MAASLWVSESTILGKQIGTTNIAVSDASKRVIGVLDVEVTPELEAEGLARDVVRQIQQTRKDRDLDISDRIALTI